MQCTWHVWPFLLRRDKKAEAMALKNCLGAASLTKGQRLCYGGTTCVQCPGHNIGAAIPNLCLQTNCIIRLRRLRADRVEWEIPAFQAEAAKVDRKTITNNTKAQALISSKYPHGSRAADDGAVTVPVARGIVGNNWPPCQVRNLPLRSHKPLAICESQLVCL